MPPAKKIDLIPDELRERLREALKARGFGGIVEVTEDLNFWLDEAGLEIRIAKTAVGEYSKVLKDQRDAFEMSTLILQDMDIEKESDLHKALLHMIAAMAMQMMRKVRDDNNHLPAKDLMALGRMLKDLMASAGIREKLREDERLRVAREAREAAANDAVSAAREAGLSEEGAEAIKAKILGVAA